MAPASGASASDQQPWGSRTPTLLYSQSSQESFTEESGGGGGRAAGEEERRVSVEDIKQAHLSGVCRRLAVYGSDTAPSRGGTSAPVVSVARRCPAAAEAEAEADTDAVDLEKFYSEGVSSFLDREGMHFDNPSYRWHWVASFLRSSLGPGFGLSGDVLGRLLTEGMLEQGDPEVRRAVCALLVTLCVDHNPPLCEETSRSFLRWFFRDKVKGILISDV